MDYPTLYVIIENGRLKEKAFKGSKLVYVAKNYADQMLEKIKDQDPSSTAEVVEYNAN